MTIKLLLVEDDEGDRQGFIQSVERYNHQHGTEIFVEACETLDDALETIDSSFDGAVVDMKLGMTGGEGNELLKALDVKNIRIPVVVFTGTPDAADHQYVHIDVKTKDTSHFDILDDFKLVHASGLTKIMGRRGLLEDLLGKVYKSNILSQKEVWKTYGQSDPSKSEKALMRHVMNHLIQMVDMDEESCVPEEFYIFPPVNETVRTGTVVQSEKTGEFYAVLTPLCDLTNRGGGEINARKIMLCKIATLEDCIAELPLSKQNAKGKASLAKNLSSNNKGSYHALPETGFFCGGFLDFEALSSIPKNQFKVDFSSPYLQISPAFTKDVIARFSSYFGRQGQPSLTVPEE